MNPLPSKLLIKKGTRAKIIYYRNIDVATEHYYPDLNLITNKNMVVTYPCISESMNSKTEFYIFLDNTPDYLGFYIQKKDCIILE